MRAGELLLRRGLERLVGVLRGWRARPGESEEPARDVALKTGSSKRRVSGGKRDVVNSAVVRVRSPSEGRVEISGWGWSNEQRSAQGMSDNEG